MSTWINLGALWKIVVIGLLTGAGLPALFAVALRLLNPPGPETAPRAAAGPVRLTLALLIFAVMLATIGWGISVIVNQR
ncbi:hypothetical protein SLA_0438 [Streptomyces laurentii]|uniref:Uncharacterized protein n=1 Tax=Streptomyces laurentii TaxID=39478 RepID=A0A160NUW8_STRLU|nr:hypothetical protein SLA_0438 [Streptomyces laurentii]